MILKRFLILFVCTAVCFGQALPDRDELAEKFKSGDYSAARELIKHFQMGGLRTIIRNVNDLPKEERLKFVHVFRHMDLSRFRNDLNANVINAEDPETRAMWLMLLSSIGRQLDPATFEKFSADETQPLMVRLAAQAGLCQVQNPTAYDTFHELADKAVIDPTTGQNDLLYANLSKSNRGLFFYTKGKAEKDKASYGVIVTALAMADGSDEELFKAILDMRSKKYVPMILDCAIQTGAANVLELMADHKYTKKRFKNEINYARPAATIVAKFRSGFFGQTPLDTKKYPLGPALPLVVGGAGKDGYRSAYAIVKVTKEGKVEVVETTKPFGGGDNVASLNGTMTMPAYLDWDTVESTHLIVAP